VIALLLAASAMSCVIGFAGCSRLKRADASTPEQYVAVDDQTQRPATPTTIQISYANPDDTLQSVVVSQFTGAEVLRTSGQGDAEASLVRFDGGVPIWQFHADRSVLNPISEIKKAPYHVSIIEYAKVPKGFAQDVPETGPPPPLDAGGYYIFAITRASGATSYQAVRVRSDLTIQAYDADPRAGTSYKLCCNISADFREPAISNPDQPDQSAQPVESAPPDQSGQPDQAEQPDNSPLVPPIPPDPDSEQP
jgi:hypothetical protein